MSNQIRVPGYIKYGKWIPLYRTEKRVSQLDVAKSGAGYKFATQNKIDVIGSFGGFAYAVFGVGGSRNKLIKFEKGEGVFNFIIDGSAFNDVRAEINKKRAEIASKATLLRQDAVMLILVSAVNDYDSIKKQIKVDIRGEQSIVADLVEALNNSGFHAYPTDLSWNKVDAHISAIPDAPKVEIVRNRDFFIVEPDVNAAFTAAVYTMKFKGTAKIMLTGPSGFGKTTAAKMLAKKLGFSFTKVDCSTLVEPNDIVHVAGFRDGKTVFDETKFVKAITSGNSVVLLDELNRAYPNVLNTLLPVLDDTRTLTVGTETYEVADNVIFIATANIGQQYVGTFSSDSALLNRFPNSARVGELSGEDEANIVYHHTELTMEQSNAVVGLLRELRKTLTNTVLDFSPRTAEAIGMALASGFEMHAAVRIVLNAVSTQEEWKVITDILQVRGFSYKKPKGLLF